MAIVGPGRIGRSLAEALEASAAGVRAELHGREASRSSASTVVFCVPDDALAAAAAARAPMLATAAREEGPAPVALHTSGVHPASILDPLRQLGYAVAAWHPLTVVDRPAGAALLGVTWGLEGDAEAVERAEALTEALAGRTLRLAADQHARYHAAAVFASNFVVACLGVATDELREAVDRSTPAASDDPAVGSLLPLARAAIDAVARGGVRRGLTGPVVRGDVGTVRRHLEALDGERRELYQALARELLRLAGPDLPPDRAAALEEALGRTHRDGTRASGGKPSREEA